MFNSPAGQMLRSILTVVLLSAVSLGVSLWLIRSSFFDNSPPTVKTASPSSREIGVPVSAPIRVAFSEAIKSITVSSSTLSLRDSDDRLVPTTVSYQTDTDSATLRPTAPLEHSATYKVTIGGGPSGIQDDRGRIMTTDLSWSFTTGAPSPPPPTEGPGGPILVVASNSNLFSRYYAEILHNEGFNEFAVTDISIVTSATLRQYDIAILGEFPLDREQTEMFVDWVRNGGNLIAMRPDKQLAERIGLKDLGTVLADGYLSIDTTQAPGAGLVKETMQFHGPADVYEPSGTTVLATLYSAATVATGSPAVVLGHLGSGLSAAFTYDLARSVVYTRQGNPAWAGRERDGIPPVRSDDLFYGPAASDPEPNWFDFNKVAVPQADLQQRFLANLILFMNSRKRPLPRFWYFPNGFKAVVIMTGDDHGHGGTLGRFLILQTKDPPDCSLVNWECARATSNIYPGTITNSQATDLTGKGFEIGLHLYTQCLDWPTETTTGTEGKPHRRISWPAADALYTSQLAEFKAAYPGLPDPRTSRAHCVPWEDYDTQPQLELRHGIRLDTNYYYWPPSWVGNRPGMFTGSGMPMRFAKIDGGLIDVYQAATQMTDESGQTYPHTINSLLSNALGPNEYYGAFTANMHTDSPESAGSDAIVAAAQSRGVPIVSARQMLTWLDGRNGSSFQKLLWDGQGLEFTVSVGEGGNGIHTLIPLNSAAGMLNEITFNNESISYEKRTVAGVPYADFSSPPGDYRVSYLSSHGH
jgi:hypothetical protein